MARAESRHGERGAAEGGGGYGGSEDEYEDEYEDEHENSAMENPEALLARTEIGREMAKCDPETYRGLVRGMEPGTGAEDMPWLGRDEERARREWERLERSFHQITGPWEEQPGGQARMQQAARETAHAAAEPVCRAAAVRAQMDPTAGGQTPEGWPQITRPTGEKVLETARAAREMAAEGLMFEDRNRCQRALELLRDSAQDLLALEQGATPHHLAENLARRDEPLARELHAQGDSEDAPPALGWTSGEDAGRRGETIFEVFQESMERMSPDFRDQSAQGLSQAMTRGLEARMKRDMDEETEYEAWEQLDQARDGARRSLAANDPQGFGRAVRTLAQAAGRAARSAGAG